MKDAERGVTIAARLASVRGRIAAAAARAGRDPAGVALVAVSKTVPPSTVAAAVAAGQRAFGENRVQEARAKIGALGPGLSWHLVGHLQRNKARLAAGLFDVVESLDSRELAAELARQASAAGRTLRVLIQVRLADEQRKSGVSEDEAPALAEAVQGLAGLELAGLMCLPPLPRDAEDSRPYFAALRRLRDRLDGACCPPGTLRELSMGMSADYEVAVEEGATIVRVGTALFGNRP